jgi:hypothetical protein
MGLKKLFAMQVVNIMIFFVDEPAERLFEKCSPGYAKEGSAGEVCFQDQPFFGNGAIA